MDRYMYNVLCCTCADLEGGTILVSKARTSTRFFHRWITTVSAIVGLLSHNDPHYTAPLDFFQ